MASHILERQNIIRQWWHTQAYNPPLLKLSSTRWGHVDVVERWMDMQARCACANHGAIVASDTRWGIILGQLEFPPLWLMKNLHENSSRKRYKAMLSQYHLVQRVEGRWTLVPAPSINFSEDISAPDDEIYEWLGVVGGVLRSFDPDYNDAALTSLTVVLRGQDQVLTPKFDPDITEYQVATSTFTARFIYTIPRHFEATVSTVLSPDFRTATVTVTAPDGVTTKVYTLRVNASQ